MRYAWTTIYVPDVAAAVGFYERAFGLEQRFMAEGAEYAELETGVTALGLAASTMAASNFVQPIRKNDAAAPPAGIEIGFETDEVAAAYARAIEAGAAPLAKPQQKPWWQMVAYVRDPNWVLVELGSTSTGGG